MKKLLLCLSVLSVSLTSMANDKIYKCLSSDEIHGTQIKDASISFTKGFGDSIKNASLVVRSEEGVLLETGFRSARFVERTNHVVMSGKNNSRINPFADAEFLNLKGLNENYKFSELSSSQELAYESWTGPIGNRGGLGFSLNCSLIN